MKFKIFIPIALFLLLSGCAEQEKNNLQMEENQLINSQLKLTLPNLKDIDFEIPIVDEWQDNLPEGNNALVLLSPGTNQLQDAINNAGNNTTIRLLAGTHIEEEIVVVNHKVKVEGEEGAILSLGGLIGVLVTNANKTTISNLEMANSGTCLIGIGVENSDHVKILNNDMSGFPYSVVLEQANHANVNDNVIVGNNPTDDIGITAVNGDHVMVKGNDVSNNLFGIWACDKKGKAINNYTHGNTIGLILCNVPQGSFPLGTGTGGSEFPAQKWKVVNNTSDNNVWGYLVIDGSINNTLSNNSASGNLFVDMELAGVTNDLFGFETPISENNTVNTGGQNISIIDCGLNNVVHGGTALSGPCSE